MYFKKLEIFGFKSFAEKTTLNFEPGITAIVGPNGCGKSNVFDSIRWVLGEQSIKELRGSTKEDVIFNGTAQKSPLGFAEVSLTFSNESRMLPIEYDEVTVTRRLFRSGESEYLLNKTTVRLKDIQELMMGTGIGAQAYSMVQQGRVDLVVSAKPEERRAILDEAAGITKYKSKKKEAMNKLKATEANLLRVNDITVEVKRQIGSIERQANKARKYKEEYEKLKSLEIVIAQKQMQEFNKDKQSIMDDLQKLKDKESKFTAQVEESNNILEFESHQLADVEQQINEITSQELKLENEIDLNNRQIGFNQERIENINTTNQKLKEQKEQLIEKCRLQQEKIEELKSNISTLNETVETNAQELNVKKNELAAVEKLINEAKDKIKDHEEKILNLTSSQVNARNNLTDAIKESQGAIARQKRLEMEIEKIAVEKQEVDQKLQNAEYQHASLGGTLHELEARRDTKQQLIEGLSEKREGLQTSIIDLEKKKMFFKSQKDFIEKMTVQYKDMPDPIVEGRLLTQNAPSKEQMGIVGKVKEVRSLDNHHLSYFKRERNDKELFEIICETKFIELDPNQLNNRMNDVDQEIEQINQQKNQLEEKIDAHQRELDQVEQEIRTKENALSVLSAQKQDIQEDIRKLITEKEVVESELKEVAEALEGLKVKENELNYELDTLEQELQWCQGDIKEKQDWIAKKSEEKEEVTIALAQLEAEINSFNDKLKNQQDNLNLFSETLDNWLSEIKSIDDETSTHASKVEQFDRENEELKVKIEEVRVQKDSLKGTFNEHEIKKNEINQKVEGIRAQLGAAENGIRDIKQQEHEVQLKEQRLAFNEQALKDKLIQTYKIDYDQIPADQMSSSEEVDQSSGEVSAADVEKLRKRCESYGNVNLVAIEEFEELKQRFEFLTSQQADLLEAKSQLMSTINKINRSTRQMFIDTFNKVNEEFQIHFRMLFGGGQAELVLLDPENVLESGVDIVARPPGKKLQNISLLSGGEKTLTAIGLIFGVFKVNPSPFCVLDEIDAALDESNVGRFSYMLKDFAKVAQFIVITHNKKTISAADIMYGVTMPETGISRIVSVKLHDSQQGAQDQVPAAV